MFTSTSGPFTLSIRSLSDTAIEKQERVIRLSLTRGTNDVSALGLRQVTVTSYMKNTTGKW